MTFISSYFMFLSSNLILYALFSQLFVLLLLSSLHSITICAHIEIYCFMLKIRVWNEEFEVAMADYLYS